MRDKVEKVRTILLGFGEVDSRNDDGGNERVTLLLLSL